VIQVPSSCLKVRERAFLEFIRPAVIRITEGREFPRAVVELLPNGRYGEAEALVPEVEEIKAQVHVLTMLIVKTINASGKVRIILHAIFLLIIMK